MSSSSFALFIRLSRRSCTGFPSRSAQFWSVFSIALFITDTIVTVLTIRKLNEKLTVINDMSARLRKESDAISNGLGRLTLLADEKITEQKQEFDEKARPVLEEKL